MYGEIEQKLWLSALLIGPLVFSGEAYNDLSVLSMCNENDIIYCSYAADDTYAHNTSLFCDPAHLNSVVV